MAPSSSSSTRCRSLLLITLLVSLFSPVGKDAPVVLALDGSEVLAPPWRNWRVVNDNVMGGVSTSAVKISNDQLNFKGNISFDNNGGFASARMDDDARDLSDYQGLLVHYTTTQAVDVKAINMQVYERFPQIGFGGFRPRSFSAAFVVVPTTELQTFYMPFDRFRGTNGFTRPDATSRFTPSQMLRMGLQVSFQLGEFDVTLQKIEAVSGIQDCIPPSIYATGCDDMTIAEYTTLAKDVLKKSNYGAGSLYPNAGAALMQYALACAVMSDDNNTSTQALTQLEEAQRANGDLNDNSVLESMLNSLTSDSPKATTEIDSSPAAKTKLLSKLFGC
ncbi:hypothetical protein PPROV_000158800 [Pycnococcus provasolii]|uniref:NADH:ubiquinone oxidoreductase intermediate-associated protein 30 domain-containing protein n=2 Tax=Chlorophyta TaxID=3041 RepID=A0A830H8X6_9CHLO|nr:hypothetical protein PPROV_000158800 [Pycnococcus provasolii]